MKTLVSQWNCFEPSSERGNFLNLAKYSDIPSSHGDFPECVLSYSRDRIKINIKQGSFKISTRSGSIILVAPSFEDAGFYDLYDL